MSNEPCHITDEVPTLSWMLTLADAIAGSKAALNSLDVQWEQEVIQFLVEKGLTHSTSLSHVRRLKRLAYDLFSP